MTLAIDASETLVRARGKRRASIMLKRHLLCISEGLVRIDINKEARARHSQGCALCLVKAGFATARLSYVVFFPTIFFLSCNARAARAVIARD